MTHERRPSPALDAEIDAHLLHLRVERGLAKNTLDAYSRDLASFAECLVAQGVTDALEVDTIHIVAWVQSLAERGFEPSSQARKLVAVRGFFRKLVEDRRTDRDPAALVDAPKRGRVLPKSVDSAGISRLFDETDDSPRDHALVALLYGAGLRVGEVVGLDVGAVELAHGVVRVRGKGNKDRIVPIGEPVIAAVRSHIEHARQVCPEAVRSRWLFPGRSGKKPLTRQAVFQIVRRVALRAGLRDDVSPHALRHAFATHLVQGGADLRSVQAMLGHASLRTTEIYTHIDDAHLRRTYDRAHPRS